MNVALPEVDGRLFSGAISFKARRAANRRARICAAAEPSKFRKHCFAARLASAWARLRATPPQAKKLAFVLSDYPGKGGRAGYAVGLDTFASVENIASRLGAEGFELGEIPAGAEIAKSLTGPAAEFFDVARYEEFLGGRAEKFRGVDHRAMGRSERRPGLPGRPFRLRGAELGNSVVALQPDRGRSEARKDDYHNFALPPRHAYVAFYLWLREILGVHALVHVGAHGTLEWLPGKAVALSENCAPRATLGALPVIYPFIVNNPGEAAQAKRRTCALTLSHLTPPLVAANAHGAVQEIEGLMDEFSEAQTLDARRARRARRTDPSARAGHRPCGRSRPRRRSQRRGRADPPRRLAVRPQGNAHRRRPAHFRRGGRSGKTRATRRALRRRRAGAGAPEAKPESRDGRR